MQMESIRVSLPNCLLFIEDANNPNIPEIDGKKAVRATENCIAVMCLPDVEGDVEISIGSLREVRATENVVFDGWLRTASRRLVLARVPGEVLFECAVQDVTRVAVWTDGKRLAEKVLIGVETCSLTAPDPRCA